MGVSYVFTPASSWAIKSLALRPIGTVQVNETVQAVNTGSPSVTLTFPDFASSGTHSPSGYFAGDGGEAATGDLLVAVFGMRSGNTVSRSGWTSMSTVTGTGTKDVTIGVCYKVAAAGDISGGLAFTFGTSWNSSGVIHAIRAGTFDAGLLVTAEAGAGSSGDSNAHSPARFARGDDQVLEFHAARGSSGSPGVSVTDDADTTSFFVNQSLDGIGSYDSDIVTLGFRYLSPAGGWHVGGLYW